MRSGDRARWWAMRLVAVLLAALSAFPAAAAPGLRPLSVCVSQQTATAAALFDAPDRFDCRTPQASFGPGDFWIRPTTIPAGAGTTLTRVRSGSQWMDALSLYVRYADGRIMARRLDARAISAHLKLGATVEFVLPDRTVPVTGLLWHVEGAGNFRRILGDTALATATASDREDFVSGVLYAGFAGLCLALIVYNLALWTALRQRFQLAYCAMVAAIASYATGASGVIVWLFPTMANNLRVEIVYLMMPLTMSASLWFAQAFFHRKGLPRALDRALSGIIAWLLVNSAVFALLAPWHMQVIDRLLGIGFALALLATVPMIVVAWRQSLTFLLIFVLAWASPAMIAWMRTANTFHLTRQGFSLQDDIVIVMAVEALLSSLAIAYRIHRLARERDEARAQEIAARLLADTDPLTGLLNRRSFLARAVERSGDQMLLIADLDHFKTVNETIGHDGGDEVLRIVARALRSVVPPDSLVARIGGEEFAIVVDAGAGFSAASVLARLRAERMPFDLRVTASIGSCVGPIASESDWSARYREADRALFEAKAAGRDRARRAATWAHDVDHRVTA